MKDLPAGFLPPFLSFRPRWGSNALLNNLETGTLDRSAIAVARLFQERIPKAALERERDIRTVRPCIVLQRGIVGRVP